MNNIDFTFCELREREVINIADGKRLGRLCDIAFNNRGTVLGIIVPGEKNFFKNITGADSIFIPWNCIVKIGHDVILVNLSNHRTAPPPPPHHEGKHEEFFLGGVD